MQRHEARLAELGAANRQHRRLEVDILKLEIVRFAEAQARDAQQPEQAVEGPGPQRTALIAAGHVERCAQ